MSCISLVVDNDDESYHSLANLPHASEYTQPRFPLQRLQSGICGGYQDLPPPLPSITARSLPYNPVISANSQLYR